MIYPGKCKVVGNWVNDHLEGPGQIRRIDDLGLSPCYFNHGLCVQTKDLQSSKDKCRWIRDASLFLLVIVSYVIAIYGIIDDNFL